MTRRWFMPVSSMTHRMRHQSDMTSGRRFGPFSPGGYKRRQRGLQSKSGYTDQFIQGHTVSHQPDPSTPSTAPFPSAALLTQLLPVGAVREQPKPAEAPARRGRVPRPSGTLARSVHDTDAGRIQGDGVELLPPNCHPASSRDREGE